MTFENMADIAKSINNIPIEQQQQLLNKERVRRTSEHTACSNKRQVQI